MNTSEENSVHFEGCLKEHYTIWDRESTLYSSFELALGKSVEDTEHYFLLCHAYDVFRNDLLNSVNAILLPSGIKCPSNEELLKVILYGHEQLSFDSNAKILRAALEYIHISKRFE